MTTIPNPKSVAPKVRDIYNEVQLRINDGDYNTDDPAEIEDAVHERVYSLTIEEMLAAALDDYPPESEVEGEQYPEALVNGDHWPNPLLFRTPVMEYDASPIAMIERNLIEEVIRMCGVEVES